MTERKVSGRTGGTNTFLIFPGHSLYVYVGENVYFLKYYAFVYRFSHSETTKYTIFLKDLILKKGFFIYFSNFAKIFKLWSMVKIKENRHAYLNAL